MNSLKRIAHLVIERLLILDYFHGDVLFRLHVVSLNYLSKGSLSNRRYDDVSGRRRTINCAKKRKRLREMKSLPFCIWLLPSFEFQEHGQPKVEEILEIASPFTPCPQPFLYWELVLFAKPITHSSNRTGNSKKFKQTRIKHNAF